MSDVRARYVGHPDGIDALEVPLADGTTARVPHISHGGELPAEIDGVKVPAAFRDSLLEQSDNWTRVERQAHKPAAKTEAKTAPTGEDTK